MRNLCDLDDLHITAQTGDKHFDNLEENSEEAQKS